MLPRHYGAKNIKLMMDAYIGVYLKEEILAEALTRNASAFIRFLDMAAFSNGEVANFTNIARECGVSGPTVREYFQILEDTLIGRFLPSYRTRPKRRVIQSPKFYFFDVGIANALMKRGKIEQGGELFGRTLEHFLINEIQAHSHYSGIRYPVAFWRSASGLEIDAVLGEHDVGIEIKGTLEVQLSHLRGMRAFREEYRMKRSIVVSLDTHPRIVDGIEILPVKQFLDELWGGRML
jgi:predicted AAA+ superfamily ATPase